MTDDTNNQNDLSNQLDTLFAELDEREKAIKEEVKELDQRMSQGLKELHHENLDKGLMKEEVAVLADMKKDTEEYLGEVDKLMERDAKDEAKEAAEDAEDAAGPPAQPEA